MGLVLTLNNVSRNIDLDHYPELNQDSDEKCLDTVQTALDIGLRALSQAHNTLDTQALQRFVEDITQKANHEIYAHSTILLSQLAENGQTLHKQHSDSTQTAIDEMRTHSTVLQNQIVENSQQLSNTLAKI